MIDVMHARGARVLLVTLGQNLADWPPGGSRHDERLSDSARIAWNAHLGAGDCAETEGCASALAYWEHALAIDPTVADLHFRIGRGARRLGDVERARHHYRLASDLDVIPHGTSSRLDASIAARARARGTLLLDFAAHLEAEAPDRLVGDAYFLDHVQPRLATHLALAEAVGETLREAGMPEHATRWRAERWKPPDAAAPPAADPALRRQEHLVRALACALALWRACVRPRPRPCSPSTPTRTKRAWCEWSSRACAATASISSVRATAGSVSDDERRISGPAARHRPRGGTPGLAPGRGGAADTARGPSASLAGEVRAGSASSIHASSASATKACPAASMWPSSASAIRSRPWRPGARSASTWARSAQRACAP